MDFFNLESDMPGPKRLRTDYGDGAGVSSATSATSSMGAIQHPFMPQVTPRLFAPGKISLTSSPLTDQ